MARVQQPATGNERPAVVKTQPQTEKFPSATLDDMTQAYFATLPKTSVGDASVAATNADTTQLAEVDAAALLELDAEMCHAAELAALTGETATLPEAETAILDKLERSLEGDEQDEETARFIKRVAS